MLRIDFYNDIAHILNHPEVEALEYSITPDEEAALRHLLDVLGRTYYASPCAEVVRTPNQAALLEIVDPTFKAALHGDCPCIRSEQHKDHHRCKHGLVFTP